MVVNVEKRKRANEIIDDNKKLVEQRQADIENLEVKLVGLKQSKENFDRQIHAYAMYQVRPVLPWTQLSVELAELPERGVGGGGRGRRLQERAGHNRPLRVLHRVEPRPGRQASPHLRRAPTSQDRVGQVQRGERQRGDGAADAADRAARALRGCQQEGETHGGVGVPHQREGAPAVQQHPSDQIFHLEPVRLDASTQEEGTQAGPRRRRGATDLHQQDPAAVPRPQQRAEQEAQAVVDKAAEEINLIKYDPLYFKMRSVRWVRPLCKDNPAGRVLLGARAVDFAAVCSLRPSDCESLGRRAATAP
jgi:hypothetical protein